MVKKKLAPKKKVSNKKPSQMEQVAKACLKKAFVTSKDFKFDLTTAISHASKIKYQIKKLGKDVKTGLHKYFVKLK